MNRQIIENSEQTANIKFGANFLPAGQVEFNLWAPDASDVKLCLQTGKNYEEIPMNRNSEGWYSLVTDKAKHKDLYQYKIDNDLKVPDPVSRYQADDVHGQSMLIDPAKFNWGKDKDWKGRPWEETVLYELHTGTFSKEGTFNGIKEKLDYFVSLGVNAIELMPVADFPGKRNWGYDGVLQYAPDSSYGTPDELKELIKSAHSKGISVFIDVVYNHFGPDGNYLYVYAKSKFFDHKKHTPWGSAINFSERIVREFFINNAIYWLEEYRFDGIRFDAFHEINDDSSPNIIEEIAERIRQKFDNGRHIHLVQENDKNEARYLDKHYTAQWNDDFHHCTHILATGEDSGYYGDYTRTGTGKPVSYYMARVLSEGFAYQGENSPYRSNVPRGDVSSQLSPLKFVNFIQNHDQTGNRAFGERISVLSTPEKLKAVTSLYLLAPSIPLLFMGEEFGSKTPFYFFCNFNEELSAAVKKGRREEFSRFPQFNDPAIIDAIPDPSDEKTFLDSKIGEYDRSNSEQSEMFGFYKDLLRLRKEKIVPLIKEVSNSEFNVINDYAFTVQWNFRSIILRAAANFGEEPVNPGFDSIEKNLLFISNPVSKESLLKGKLMPSTVIWILEEKLS